MASAIWRCKLVNWLAILIFLLQFLYFLKYLTFIIWASLLKKYRCLTTLVHVIRFLRGRSWHQRWLLLLTRYHLLLLLEDCLREVAYRCLWLLFDTTQLFTWYIFGGESHRNLVCYCMLTAVSALVLTLQYNNRRLRLFLMILAVRLLLYHWFFRTFSRVNSTCRYGNRCLL